MYELDAQTQAAIVEIRKHFNMLTHEDVEAIHRQQGTGCKSCDNPATEQCWWRCEGDIYCFACALTLEAMGCNTERIETREQRADREYWAEQGIGTN